ncbi:MULTISPECIES: ACP S-malonyltransferase [unclassified Limnobacter]|uniref:ACP S-malonyltransferase n=1 Tax=unclassified Limnobacter TaxID=2630203 RepID=UPI000156CE6E|nr:MULTISPECIES: ACP S-malonyltransferase [unclassified Limnobacter]EDM84027.1 acyl-carrier-protein S-malonyltransferase [Limnobacter sp. MED105]MAZ08864.1 [acyl-carrier-protein] S-malonyltransferase [Sutterellaceae bacterium]MBA4314648.1 [acyl-carrier-protein] S-malonyltransferase [Alcaligenaceae bacterium]|tara:strand:- start:1301 stop:2245 length:945 start_codon:yes stop_codon:yes gene_type:complete
MTKKIAFLFPGQGSQAVGMLNAFKSNQFTASVYATAALEAEQALGQDLAALIEQGPAESLNLTTNTQPAMLMADVLVLRAWLAAGGAMPNLVAGHSLGEYAALVAAGVFSLSEGLGLVRIRAQAMQEAVPVGQGGMAAILGLTDEQVKQACQQACVNGEVAEAVNFNAPSQVVIAGSAQGVKTACEAAKALGAKRALELPVSAPFHSSLMKPASVKLAAALSNTNFSTPSMPVYNNIDVAVESDPARIRDALVRQAYGPVRWVETIQAMTTAGTTLFVECGPGKVLAGLVKRISDVPVVNIFDPDSIHAALGAE